MLQKKITRSLFQRHQGQTVILRDKKKRNLRGDRTSCHMALVYSTEKKMKEAKDGGTWLGQFKVAVDSHNSGTKNGKRGRGRYIWVCQWLHRHQSQMRGSWDCLWYLFPGTQKGHTTQGPSTVSTVLLFSYMAPTKRHKAANNFHVRDFCNPTCNNTTPGLWS